MEVFVMACSAGLSYKNAQIMLCGVLALMFSLLFFPASSYSDEYCTEEYWGSFPLDGYRHCAMLGDYNEAAKAHELWYGYENISDEKRLFTFTWKWGANGIRVTKNVPVAPHEKKVMYFLVKDAALVEPSISIESRPWSDNVTYERLPDDSVQGGSASSGNKEQCEKFKRKLKNIQEDLVHFEKEKGWYEPDCKKGDKNMCKLYNQSLKDIKYCQELVEKYNNDINKYCTE
jgi:hypothetical protein